MNDSKIGPGSITEDKSCPCKHTTPCHERCTCVMSFSSSGCRRCCTYGSAEQQLAKAARLAEFIDLGWERLERANVEDVAHKDVAHTICWEGDWRLLPRTCGGNVEVWDQTIGCPECGMNLWYLPAHGKWPAWDLEHEPPSDWWTSKTQGRNEYTPYAALFFAIHPFTFGDCHDYGDAHDDNPPGIIGPP